MYLVGLKSVVLNCDVRSLVRLCVCCLCVSLHSGSLELRHATHQLPDKRWDVLDCSIWMYLLSRMRTFCYQDRWGAGLLACYTRVKQ